ncbi:MAG: thiamine-phosphate kinase [Thermoguttaceae bacterium]|jgi:thiamine-monophosphate kinase
MESALIAWLRERLPPHPLLRLGIGDDAAVLSMAGVEQCAITVDALTDHVDFELSHGDDPRRVGRKALAVNLSDLAAMAAEPLAGVVALVLPKQNGMNLAQALFEGMLPLAEKYNLALAGGDTNSWDGPLVISITLLGKVTQRGPLRRGGAKPGDRILAIGSFGGSILGKHFDFQPRVEEALLLNQRYQLHAGIDVSDGLSIDLARMAKESGCGAILQTDAIPIADEARLLSQQRPDGLSPLDHALGDGEDFELLLAAPPDDAQRILADQPLDVQITDIGEFIAEPGLWQREAGNPKKPLVPQGWEHDFN